MVNVTSVVLDHRSYVKIKVFVEWAGRHGWLVCGFAYSRTRHDKLCLRLTRREFRIYKYDMKICLNIARGFEMINTVSLLLLPIYECCDVCIAMFVFSSIILYSLFLGRTSDSFHRMDCVTRYY